MKKVMFILLSAFLILGLFGCRDKKTTVEGINVLFYNSPDVDLKVPEQKNLKPGDKVKKPADPVRVGYEFAGWFTNPRGLAGTEWDFDNDTVGEKTFMLYPKFVPAKYQIEYDVNYGTMPKEYPTEYFTGQTVILPKPSKEGYVFKGWYLYDWEKDGDTKPGDPGYTSISDKMSGDLKFYAHYQARKYSVIFHLNLPNNEASQTRTWKRILVKYETYLENLPVPTDPGKTYEFIGWNSDIYGLGNWYENDQIFLDTGTVHLYAQWE